MATQTYLTLKNYLSQSLGDYLSVAVTTAIAASKLIVSTNLNSYDDAEDGHFNNWWVDITDKANITIKRKLGSTTYATSSGTAYVYGANLTTDGANLATANFHRYDPNKMEQALLEALKEVYPQLHIPVDDITLITGNILPDGHFESWSSTSALTYWTATNITLLKTSTAGSTRGGLYSAKCTATATNGYISVHSNTYPRLLDLQDKTVSAYVQALPEVANDASIVIYTKQVDGTTQTLTSTTTCPAGEFTQLELEDQKLNDNLAEFELRLKVATDTKYVYFDDVYLNGMPLSQYLLPDNFAPSSISRVYMQTSGTSDPVFYDLNPFITQYSGQSLNYLVFGDGTYQWLRLLEDVPSGRRLRLIGDKPLETPSAYTDTVTLDNYRVPLLIAKARMIFWERMAVPITTEDKSKYEYEYNKAARDYSQLLGTKTMPRLSKKVYNG